MHNYSCSYALPSQSSPFSFALTSKLQKATTASTISDLSMMRRLSVKLKHAVPSRSLG